MDAFSFPCHSFGSMLLGDKFVMNREGEPTGVDEQSEGLGEVMLGGT